VGTGVWDVLQRGQEQSPGGGLGAKPPEARYAYTICNGQTHFRDVFIEDIQCTVGMGREFLFLVGWLGRGSEMACTKLKFSRSRTIA